MGFQVGQTVKVVNEDTVNAFEIGELIFGKTHNVDCFGVVKEVSPKDLRVYEEFAHLPEAEATTGLNNTLVYYDEGAQHNFIVEMQDLEVL